MKKENENKQNLTPSTEKKGVKTWVKSKFKRRKTQPWKKFLPKLAVTLGVILLAGSYVMARYEIVYDDQKIKCIPEYEVYLLDKWDRKVERDKMYVFYARNTEPVFDQNTKLLKYARGMPGDRVAVTPDTYNVQINGETLFEGLPNAEALNREWDSFVVEGTLSEENYWFFGTSELSFDSRYWGSVNEEQIIGRAYPLF